MTAALDDTPMPNVWVPSPKSYWCLVCICAVDSLDSGAKIDSGGGAVKVRQAAHHNRCLLSSVRQLITIGACCRSRWVRKLTITGACCRVWCSSYFAGFCWGQSVATAVACEITKIVSKSALGLPAGALARKCWLGQH